MAKKKRNDTYPRPLKDGPAWAALSTIEEWSGRVPYEMTPLALNNLHRYIIYLEDTVEMLRHRLNQLGAHHPKQEEPCPNQLKLSEKSSA